MPGTWTSRLTLELFLSAIGGSSGTVEPWVAERLTAILEQEDVRAGERISPPVTLRTISFSSARDAWSSCATVSTARSSLHRALSG